MVLGPITATDFQLLKERLDEANLPYRSFVDEAVRENPRLTRPPREEPAVYPTYQAPNPYLYLEVLSSQGLLLLKGDLEKMGIRVVERDTDESLAEEYLCSKCDHQSTEPGLCPRHQVPLISFEKWCEARQARQRSSARVFTVVTMLCVLLPATAVILHMFGVVNWEMSGSVFGYGLGVAILFSLVDLLVSKFWGRK